MPAAADAHNMHRRVGVGRRRDETATLGPSGWTDEMDIVSVARTQQALALPALLHDAGVVDPQDACARHEGAVPGTPEYKARRAGAGPRAPYSAGARRRRASPTCPAYTRSLASRTMPAASPFA